MQYFQFRQTEHRSHTFGEQLTQTKKSISHQKILHAFMYVYVCIFYICMFLFVLSVFSKRDASSFYAFLGVFALAPHFFHFQSVALEVYQ